MSIIIDSLKKQNAFLQGEVERFAGAVDSLAAQLADAQAKLNEYEPQPSETDGAAPPADPVPGEGA